MEEGTAAMAGMGISIFSPNVWSDLGFLHKYETKLQSLAPVLCSEMMIGLDTVIGYRGYRGW